MSPKASPMAVEGGLPVSSMCVCVLISSSCENTSHIGLGPELVPHFILITSLMIPSPNPVPFWVPRVRTSTYGFRDTIQPMLPVLQLPQSHRSTTTIKDRLSPSADYAPALLRKCLPTHAGWSQVPQHRASDSPTTMLLIPQHRATDSPALCSFSFYWTWIPSET